MSIIRQFKAAVEAFRQKPTMEGITAKSTQQLLWMFKRRQKNLTPQTRDEIKQNPYVYAALRNTADEIVGKWNGASGYIPRDASESHLRRPPQILAASSSALHQRQAQHLRWNIDYRLKRGWESILRALLHGREDGKSVLEVCWQWQPSGPWKGSWIIDDILHCDPSLFNFSYKKVQNPYTGEIEFQRQMNYNPNGGLGGRPVPPGKFILYSFDRSYENDEGNSILNKLNLYDWYQRNNFIFWLVDLNRYGSPLLVAKYRENATQTQQDALFAALQSIQQETGIMISEKDKIEILQASRNGAAGFEVLNRIINAIISVVITGNTLSMENAEAGSFALAEATTAEIRMIILYALSTALDNVINHQLIYYWMLYNYPMTQEHPKHQLLAPRFGDVAMASPEPQTEPSHQYVPVQFAEAEPKEPSDLLVENAVRQSLAIFDATWITPITSLIRQDDNFSSHASLMSLSSLLEEFNPDLSNYEDLLLRSMLTAHILGRWQISQEMPSQQFAENDFSDIDLLKLLSSPVALDKAEDIMLAKRLMSKREFEQLVDQLKRSAFTIAGKENEKIQALVRQAIADAISEGIVEGKELERRAIQVFQKYGVTNQTPYHAQTVFRTNIQSALHDARWQMMNSPEIRPLIAYLEYLTKEDPRVRATHRKMHGIIRPMDDPVWQRWYPPNGYNCRCKVRVVSHEEAQRRNIQPTPTLPNVQPDDGFASGPSMPYI